jgi:protein-S-isoprenylcysteine O-methyltransferase Ste14
LWLPILGLVIYRAFHLPPDRFGRIKAVALAHGSLMACGIMWLAFILYWETAAKNASAEKSSESALSRGFHVGLVNAALLLMFVPVTGLKGRFLPQSPMPVATGLILQGCGLALAIRSRVHLGRNWSGRITIKLDHELVRSGPYRMVRHPIYTAILAMYAGTTLVSGEWHALIGISLALLAYWRKMRMEEANLATAFGADYSNYRRMTWSLLPWVY